MALWGHRTLGPLLLTLVTAGCLRDASPVVDYNYDVQPILADNCYACHGPDPESREAELSLHTEAGLYASLRDDTTRHVIVPGDPGASEFVRRITDKRPRERMPPPEAQHALTDAEIQTLTRWVAQGAEWKPHWSLIPQRLPDLPGVRQREWTQNEIDHFVLARLERNGLDPAEEADRRTLIRRLHLDLTGLPPSVEDVRVFVADNRPDAYEHLVDRVLASPHFGERMAVHWLDLARYADTNGYSIDGGRHMWLWRDWVIHAFNTNKPFDEFVIEQLAGDLLPEATDTQLMATGFHRNHMITHEGGTIPEENLVNYVADRVKTTGEVFLGLTFACAQCHDHKYDPITQRDYYRLFAFFNRVPERGLDGDGGVNAVPQLESLSPLATVPEIEQVKVDLATLRAETSRVNPDQGMWEERERSLLSLRGQNLQLHPLQATKVTTPNSGYTGEVQSDGSVRIDEPVYFAAYNVSLAVPEDLDAAITGLRVVFYPDNISGALGHGNGDLPESFVVTSVHVRAGALPADQVDYHSTLGLARVTASHIHPDYAAENVLDDRRHNGWSPHPVRRASAHLTLTFDEPLDASEARHFTVMLNFGAGSRQVAKHFRVLAMEGVDDGTTLPLGVQHALENGNGDSDLLRQAFYERAEESAPLRHAIANLEERLRVLTEPHPTMVMAVADVPRLTRILYRGQYDQPTDSVSPGVPSWLPPLHEDATRLDLAEWLMQPSHPLTARVTVNRFWQMLFGRGLVTTVADFGARGSLPTHPALLDWLATTFVESGFDTKALLKTMVMSATYRQSSRAAPDLLTLDPQNAFLARGPRFRLQAEFIRDQALAISGLLVRRLGGPSVRPYQPAGLWKEVSHYGSTPATAQTFAQDHGEKLYRRSLYTYWKRTAPPPGMMVFDAPTREVCTVQRENTNTPLQALVLLNDPQFVEASRAFAARLLRIVPETERITYAFEAVTGREPDGEDRQRLETRLAEEISVFEADPARARAFLSVGASSPSLSEDLATHAAWTVVASLLFNLSETITRN